ncbi:MAG: YggS family pyridoxal phosphate-dependent enzyme [Clostridia bacterium]|nr:YggS family pyridoxal phosphate-dependent enzyme [Clostridia bacterium]
MQTIREKVEQLKAELSSGNAFSEPVLLVAATKMQTVEAINEAIAAGVDAVAENKPQEFRDKQASLQPCPRHFIGHLQTNKIKYLLGKIDLYHSVDRDELLKELAKRSRAAGIISNVLLQINIGEEESKSGYALSEAQEVFLRAEATEGVCVQGFMAMLPEVGEKEYLIELIKKMRAVYEWAKARSSEIKYLSMGMSGDYKLCVAHGSNVIRVGSTIFGARNYGGGA